MCISGTNTQPNACWLSVLQMSKEWLKGTFQEKTVAMNEVRR